MAFVLQDGTNWVLSQEFDVHIRFLKEYAIPCLLCGTILLSTMIPIPYFGLNYFPHGRISPPIGSDFFSNCEVIVALQERWKRSHLRSAASF